MSPVWRNHAGNQSSTVLEERARASLEELVARIASYEIDPTGARRVHSVNVRGFETLPTTVVVR